MTSFDPLNFILFIEQSLLQTVSLGILRSSALHSHRILFMCNLLFFLKMMLNSYLVRFVEASVQLIQGHLSVTCLVCPIRGTVADVPPSLTVNVSVFITGHAVFSVQSGHSRVIHLIHHSCRWACITNLVTKTSKCLNHHWAHLWEPKPLNISPVVIMSLERLDGLLKKKEIATQSSDFNMAKFFVGNKTSSRNGFLSSESVGFNVLCCFTKPELSI